MPAFIDLTGRKFGRLTVLGKAGYKKNNRIVWRCQCSCGAIIERPGVYLTVGDTMSCGCLNRDEVIKRCRIDLTGRKFGKITVLGYDKTVDYKGRHSAFWRCRCECGTVYSVSGNSLKSGRIKSCGCENRKVASRRMTEMHYKHGLSQTPEYIHAIAKRNKDRRKGLDSDWCLAMDIALKEFYTHCVVCSDNGDLQVDHVYPSIRGNGLKVGNATILCRKCNTLKHDKMPEDLPEPMRSLILDSARKFAEYWEWLQTPVEAL